VLYRKTNTSCAAVAINLSCFTYVVASIIQHIFEPGSSFSWHHPCSLSRDEGFGIAQRQQQECDAAKESPFSNSIGKIAAIRYTFLNLNLNLNNYPASADSGA
jgi:hypothetical protein